jgi:hypothetical protein
MSGNKLGQPRPGAIESAIQGREGRCKTVDLFVPSGALGRLLRALVVELPRYARFELLDAINYPMDDRVEVTPPRQHEKRTALKAIVDSRCRRHGESPDTAEARFSRPPTMKLLVVTRLGNIDGCSR